METAVILVRRVPRAELLDHLHGSDVVILPAICADEPVSILEGIACGAALMADRVGGIPDLIRDGRNGPLYEPREPKMLAAALQEMIGRLGPRTVFLASQSGPAAELRREPYHMWLISPKRSTMSRIQDAPSHVDGRRLRLLWRRWPLGETLAASRFVWTMRPTADPSWWRCR